MDVLYTFLDHYKSILDYLLTISEYFRCKFIGDRNKSRPDYTLNLLGMTTNSDKSTNRETDLVLLQRMAANDEWAFEQIYQQYFRILYRFAYWKIQRHEESEDIAQEVLIGLWSARSNLSHITNLYNYLVSAVNYRVYNYVRHLKYVRTHQLDTLSTHLSAADNTGESLETVEFITTQVKMEIRRLPERCRTAFQLSREEEMPIDMIADCMKISKRTVENYITTALKRLRLILNIPWSNVSVVSMDARYSFRLPKGHEPHDIMIVILHQS